MIGQGAIEAEKNDTPAIPAVHLNMKKSFVIENDERMPILTLGTQLQFNHIKYIFLSLSIRIAEESCFSFYKK